MASPVYDPYPSFGKYSQIGCQRGLLTEGELGLYGTDTGRRAKDKEKYDRGAVRTYGFTGRQ